MRRLFASAIAVGLMAGAAAPVAADPRWDRDEPFEALIERRADHRDHWYDRRHHLIERRVDHREDWRDHRVDRHLDRGDHVLDLGAVGPGYWIDR